jgi:hypothetical protein
MIKRREFIAGLGSAAFAWSRARAQQRTIPVIGLLSVRPIADTFGGISSRFGRGRLRRGPELDDRLPLG